MQIIHSWLKLLYSYKWLFQNANAISASDITLPTTIVKFLSSGENEGDQMMNVHTHPVTLRNMKRGALSIERQLLLDCHHFILGVCS